MEASELAPAMSRTRACYWRGLLVAHISVVLAVTTGSLGLAQNLCSGTLQWVPGVNGPDRPENCNGSGYRCYPPNSGAPTLVVAPGCDPRLATCAYSVSLPIVYPGVHQSPGVGTGVVPAMVSVTNVTQGSSVGVCGVGGVALVNSTGLAQWSGSGSCTSGPSIFEITIGQCSAPPGVPICTCACPSSTFRWNVSLAGSGVCKHPPPAPCKDNCNACLAVGGGGAPPNTPGAPGKGGGGGCGVSVGGGGAQFCEATGPGATLRYFAGGVGHPMFPGSGPWVQALGRYWSHEWAERIVVDPDAGHVWLLTREAGFVEFTDTVADPDGLYEAVAPSDEYRKLYQTATGWELRWLDGSVQRFDLQGTWYETADRNGNPTVGIYDGLGRLAEVQLPDGRRETFTYLEGGRLASISRVGRGGSPAEAWQYRWLGGERAHLSEIRSRPRAHHPPGHGAARLLLHRPTPPGLPHPRRARSGQWLATPGDRRVPV